jgi:hypothetical protein
MGTMLDRQRIVGTYVLFEMASERAHRHVGAEVDQPDLDIDGPARAAYSSCSSTRSSPSPLISMQSQVDAIDWALYIKNVGISSLSYPATTREAAVYELADDPFFGEG